MSAPIKLDFYHSTFRLTFFSEVSFERPFAKNKLKKNFSYKILLHREKRKKKNKMNSKVFASAGFDKKFVGALIMMMMMVGLLSVELSK